MKKLLVLFILGTLLSCEINDGNEINFELQIMSVTGVDIPAEFTLGETYEITVDYLRPNGCHEFNDFIIQPNGNTRTVAVVDTVYNDPNCSVNAEEASVSFNFLVLSNGPYIFQFYQGTGTNGEDQYLIVEVPVVE